MPLSRSDEGSAPRPVFREAVRRIHALIDELKEVRDLRAANDARYEKGLAREESGFRRQERERKRRHREALERAASSGFEERKRLKALREEYRARILRAAARMRAARRADIEAEKRRARAEFAALRERLGTEVSRRRGPLESKIHRWEERIPRVRERHEDVETRLERFALRHGIEPGQARGVGPRDVDAGVDPDRLAEETEAVFDRVLARAARAGHSFRAGLARTGRLVLLFVLLLLAGAAGTVVALSLGVEPARMVPAWGGLLVLSMVMPAGSALSRRRLRRLADTLVEEEEAAWRRFERHAQAAQRDFDARFGRSAEAYARMIEEAEEEVRAASRERRRAIRLRLEEIAARSERVQARLMARHANWIREIEAREDREREEQRKAHETETTRALEAHRERIEELSRDHAETIRRLRERRETALAGFLRYRAAIQGSVDRLNVPWEELTRRRIELPEEFPGFVPFGRLRVSLAGLLDPTSEEVPPDSAIELPVATTFPEYGSLLVQHPPRDRDRAVEILLNAVFRALTSFPAGKVRLTILDPVGLGQSFSALMHLADHDEDLVDGRIWTETRHIEQRLANLTEHIEKVIQKYLRNRYDSIAEYNEEAGELQEPYHFLVVGDFPAAFSEVAAERLASILSSGPRCGVYTFIAHDTRMDPPPPLDPDLLRRNGPTLVFDSDGCRLAGEPPVPGEFLPEKPPGPGVAGPMLDRIGRLSVAAAHVELPFAAAAPEDDAVWSRSTETGVRVPIGRTGAERLQYLDLGRGTAQHALIAGRTGSGKSTLFHVMITNMSLWFSPEEIEFYLIDFKKGVEFKPYATHGLPHARVVAIESDREFGLSVLRAVDAELARRGDLFRRHEVQDLAAYRRSGAAETVPRTLLMIDEFQEFFTDDDAVAHDAAMLLDRFVRQGRAFGIHVVLGSQTLSGIYALARGTLGQMGVRIALQCNESDSYLVLSEDNGVARLLTRPGEAIYNDRSGLVEGNNPFQVVWLPEAEQQRHLRRLHERVDTTPGLRRPPLVVFEGNRPADIRGNAELRALLAEGPPETGGEDRAWLGEPNAIKGPTEVRFSPVSGANLLIVGQGRETAFAVLASMVLSLSAGHRPGGVRFVVLDGGGHEPEFAAHFRRLADATPHPFHRYDLRTTPGAVAELTELVRTRENDDRLDRSPVFVFALGLQRLRMLRREDDYAMPSFGGEPEESSAERFAAILTEGPPQGVHTIIWCDTVANLQRSLSRRALREFDMRVLFQMSAADSSELIDSSAANRLGLNTALLAVESQGTFEKFRPYALPEPEVLRRLGRGAGE